MWGLEMTNRTNFFTEGLLDGRSTSVDKCPALNVGHDFRGSAANMNTFYILPTAAFLLLDDDDDDGGGGVGVVGVEYAERTGEISVTV